MYYITEQQCTKLTLNNSDTLNETALLGTNITVTCHPGYTGSNGTHFFEVSCKDKQGDPTWIGLQNCTGELQISTPFRLRILHLWI